MNKEKPKSYNGPDKEQERIKVWRNEEELKKTPEERQKEMDEREKQKQHDKIPSGTFQKRPNIPTEEIKRQKSGFDYGIKKFVSGGESHKAMTRQDKLKKDRKRDKWT